MIAHRGLADGAAGAVAAAAAAAATAAGATVAPRGALEADARSWRVCVMMLLAGAVKHGWTRLRVMALLLTLLLTLLLLLTSSGGAGARRRRAGVTVGRGRLRSGRIGVIKGSAAASAMLPLPGLMVRRVRQGACGAQANCRALWRSHPRDG